MGESFCQNQFLNVCSRQAAMCARPNILKDKQPWDNSLWSCSVSLSPPTPISHDCYDLIPPEPSSQLPPRKPPGQRREVPTIIFHAFNRISWAHSHHVSSFTTRYAKLRVGTLKTMLVFYKNLRMRKWIYSGAVPQHQLASYYNIWDLTLNRNAFKNNVNW